MNHFRRSGLRQFVKVDGNIVLTVLNREKSSSLSLYDSAMMSESITIDTQKYPVCSEEEFTTAFKEALTNISLQRL
jgi:hypothetical protein